MWWRENSSGQKEVSITCSLRTSTQAKSVKMCLHFPFFPIKYQFCFLYNYLWDIASGTHWWRPVLSSSFDRKNFQIAYHVYPLMLQTFSSIEIYLPLKILHIQSISTTESLLMIIVSLFKTCGSHWMHDSPISVLAYLSGIISTPPVTQVLPVFISYMVFKCT